MSKTRTINVLPLGRSTRNTGCFPLTRTDGCSNRTEEERNSKLGQTNLHMLRKPMTEIQKTTHAKSTHPAILTHPQEFLLANNPFIAGVKGSQSWFYYANRTVQEPLGMNSQQQIIATLPRTPSMNCCKWLSERTLFLQPNQHLAEQRSKQVCFISDDGTQNNRCSTNPTQNPQTPD